MLHDGVSWPYGAGVKYIGSVIPRKCALARLFALFSVAFHWQSYWVQSYWVLHDGVSCPYGAGVKYNRSVMSRECALARMNTLVVLINYKYVLQTDVSLT